MSNKVYKVGLVGAGNVTKMHLDGMKRHPERVTVSAICDPNPDVLTERADQYDIPQRYTSLEDFVQESQVDVAVVCTPSHLRKVILFPLIEAGIPVFCEKPFAETVEEAIEIAEEANQHGVPVSIDQNFRKHYTFDIVKGLLAENTIGQVLGISFQDLYYRQDQGWRLTRDRHAMSVMSIHWLDGFRWILGSEAKSLVCQRASSPAIDCEGETEGFVQMAFENGTKVSMIQSFSGYKNKNEMIILGETGMLVANYQSVELYQKGDQTPRQTWENPIDKLEATYLGLAELLDSLETGKEALNSSNDNVKTISLLDAAYISDEEQRIVTFKDGFIQ
jgi:D-apiose dehydrogenase